MEGYSAFLMLGDGDDETNQRITNLYSHLNMINDEILKDTKLKLYDIELLLQKILSNIPSKAYSEMKRDALLLELEGDYAIIIERLLYLYHDMIEKVLLNASRFDEDTEDGE